MPARATHPKSAIVMRRVLSLLIRAAAIVSMAFGVAFGFLTGATSQAAHYNPFVFAVGVSALFGAACGGIGLLFSRVRQMKRELRALETRLDEAADRHWELSEAQERARDFFEAQDDVIVRRDAHGGITYASDAFCALAGRSRADLLATAFALPADPEYNVTLLPDGARAFDQRVAAAAGPRWIAWREVTLRADGRSETHSAGRDTAGFTGYLVKPVRAASLAARFRGDEAFDDRTESQAMQTPAQARSAAGLSILDAEDNEINALLARALLAKLGHRPTMVASGAEAFDSFLAARAAGAPFDRVLMDLHMPGMDGLDATRRIRAFEAQHGGARVPIVALTANAAAEDRDACLAAGMDGYLVKPFDRDRLAAALAAADKAALAA